MKVAFDDDKDQIPVKESLFMITINTNRMPRSLEERVIMQNLILAAVGDLKKYAVRREVIDFMEDGGGEHSIEEEEMKLGFETGSKMKRFHVHLVWDFIHNTKIRLNLPVLKNVFLKYFRQEFGWRNIHMDVKAVGGVKRKLEEYAKKQDSGRDWQVISV